MPIKAINLDVRFNLKSKKQKSKPTLIYAIFRYGTPTKKLVYSTRYKIAPKHWDDKRQLPRTDFPDYNLYKDELNFIENRIQFIYKSYNDIPLDDFKRNLDKELGRLDVEMKDGEFLDFMDKWISRKERGFELTERTLKKFRTSRNHLKEYADRKDINLSFDSIDWNFREDFQDWLYATKGHSQNTVSKVIQTIKQIMREARRRGVHSNGIMDEKGFGVKRTKTLNKIRLDEDELKMIMEYDYGNNSMNKVADLAIIGSYTGLRYSDWCNIKKGNIVIDDGMEFIQIMSYKTKELLTIPVLPELKKMLEKYNYKIPSVTVQEFNRTFKEVCKLAIPESKYMRIYNVKGETKAEKIHKWMKASSHACRRSFASNFYEMGFSPNLLRHITGHASEGQFLEYVVVDEKKMAKRFTKEVMRKREDAKIVKIKSA